MGANELDAIQACAAFVGVQEAYAAKKRSAAGTPEYADSVANSEVPKEFAEAAGHESHQAISRLFLPCAEGTRVRTRPAASIPYMLGKSMLGGFALVAWPAIYGVSGVHTFIVNQERRGL